MKEPVSIYAKVAVQTLLEHFGEKVTEKISKQNLPEELKIRRACFVSLHKLDGELRGCIGTIEPCTKNLFEEISKNVLSAAFNDTRFYPLTEDELDDLELSVDVLSEPEPIKDIKELDEKKYGVIVSDGHYRRGVLLPDIEGVDSVEMQLRIVKRKAGLQDENIKNLIVHRFTSTRYH